MGRRIQGCVLCILLLGLLLMIAGCGSVKLDIHTIRVQDATATEVAKIVQTRGWLPTPISATVISANLAVTDTNLSPADYPTPSDCHLTFFWGNMPGLCPDAAPMQVEAAFQVYDGGYMLWEGRTGSVYILYNGGVGQKIDQETTNTWPEAVVQTPPPANHVYPIRGFGRVWQHESSVRTTIGWPLGLEQAYTAQFQTAKLDNSVTYFYVSLPNGQVVEFINAGLWRIIR